MRFYRRDNDATAKKIKRFFSHVYSSLSKIHLVDKCLLVLMLVLLSQSAFILLTNGGQAAEANHVDIIVRTSSASIFGYFLSANFVQRGLASKPDSNTTSRQADTNVQNAGQSEMPQNRIGFALSQSSSEPENGSASVTPPASDEDKAPTICRLQILTATAIALFCLTVLILVRDIAGSGQTINTSSASIISQFRDFVSGCVGFLIGCPTPRSGSK